MALRIYLDTSDYATLYRPERDPERSRVLEHLLTRKAAGKIEIGFSYPIVWELLQEYQPEFEADRLERARCIHDLCDQNAYRFMPRTSDAFCRAGHWYPGPQRPFGIRDLEAPLIYALTDLQSNRRIRRRLRTAQGRRDFFRERPEFADLRRAPYATFTLPERFLDENVFHRYLIGEITEQDADRILIQMVTDLHVFIRNWYGHQRRPNQLMKDLFSHMQRIEDALTALQACYQQLMRSRDDIKKTNPILAKKLRWGPLQLRNDLHAGVSPDDSWIWQLSGGFFESVVVTYVEQSMKTGKAFKKSDVVDILHACYIPYCDLWRGDADFANMLMMGRVQFRERVVPRLRELPDRIDQALGAAARENEIGQPPSNQR